MHAVVTLAGEGTRMLPWSRGLRKEFLPLYDRGENGSAVLKPVAHLIVETLVRAGADRITRVVRPRDVVFVQNYFTVDPMFLARHQDHAERLTDTRRFYHTIAGVEFDFAVQPRPAGFGDAVRRAGATVGPRPFVLHAGDGVLIEPDRGSRSGRCTSTSRCPGPMRSCSFGPSRTPDDTEWSKERAGSRSAGSDGST